MPEFDSFLRAHPDEWVLLRTPHAGGEILASASRPNDSAILAAIARERRSGERGALVLTRGYESSLVVQVVVVMAPGEPLPGADLGNAALEIGSLASALPVIDATL